MSIVIRVVLIAALYVATFLTGFWMWNTFKPVPFIKVNLHKLASLGALALSVWLIVDLNKLRPLSSAALGFSLSAGVLCLASIVSGGLVSLDSPAPEPIRWLHRVGPFLTTGCSIAAVVLAW
jgi:hypothetical protein